MGTCSINRMLEVSNQLFKIGYFIFIFGINRQITKIISAAHRVLYLRLKSRNLFPIVCPPFVMNAHSLQSD